MPAHGRGGVGPRGRVGGGERSTLFSADLPCGGDDAARDSQARLRRQGAAIAVEADTRSDRPETAGARVTVEGVSKSYGQVQALRDVSLAVAPGEVVALTGPSGCGKTTLLNVIASIERPDSGRVVVDEVNVTELVHPADYRRRTIGIVFQLHHLLPMLTARANVELPLIAAGVPKAERRRRAGELLEEVGLGERADQRPAVLSGGERQRVAVARALVNGPRLLLADEPTGSLDSENGELVLSLLERARERRGMTMIVASHDPLLGRRADRRVRMVDGAIVDEVTS